MQFKCKYSLFVKNIQFSQIIQFSIIMLLVLFNP